MANANDTQDAHRLRRLRDDRLDPRTRSLRRRHSAERDGNREPRTVTDGHARSIANRQPESFPYRFPERLSNGHSLSDRYRQSRPDRQPFAMGYSESFSF